MTNEPITSMTVKFELGGSDLDYFRERLAKAQADQADEAAILEGTEALVREALAGDPPQFVRDSLKKLEPLVAMLRDKDWRLEGDDRERVVAALAYFADPNDLIPDRIPGIGFIDDAIMIELVAQGLEPELEAYAEFVAKRSKKVSGPELEKEREALQSRMRRRARRFGRSAATAPAGMKNPFSIF